MKNFKQVILEITEAIRIKSIYVFTSFSLMVYISKVFFFFSFSNNAIVDSFLLYSETEKNVKCDETCKENLIPIFTF